MAHFIYISLYLIINKRKEAMAHFIYISLYLIINKRKEPREITD
jgi:hypothetical protein